MRLAGCREYTIIAFSNEEATVCRFRRTRQKYKLAASASAEVRDGDRAAAIKTALRSAGGLTGCVILTGDLPDGGFFRCPALSVPGIREQKAALEFELPRHMARPPDNPLIQYLSNASGGNGEEDIWNVYAFPEQRLLSLEALMALSRGKADEFIHPLLAIRTSDPAVKLPHLEREFIFSGGQWQMPEEDGEPGLPAFWREEFSKLFVLPEDFEAERYIECLLVMRLLASPVFRENEKKIRILPARMRPKRLRMHIAVTCFLILLLGGIHLRDLAMEKLRIWREYQALTNERDNCRRKASRIRSELKKKEKENKELQRIIQQKAGDPDLLVRLADLCRVLPPDAVVSMLNFSEGFASMTIQSESENLNIPQLFKALPYWKISQLNQRAMNDTLIMISLNLQKAEDAK